MMAKRPEEIKTVATRRERRVRKGSHEDITPDCEKMEAYGNGFVKR